MERITEKKLRDRRFYRTENAILITLLSAKEMLSLERLIRSAGISRSTLHRHHKNIHEIAPDYERYILRKCKSTMTGVMKIKNSRLRTLYRKVLVFMSANRLIIEFLLEYGSHNLIEQIVFALKPKIISTGKVSDGEMFILYTKEVTGLIEEWCRNGFNKDTLTPILNKIMYLTDTAHHRLSPLKSFNQQVL